MIDDGAHRIDRCLREDPVTEIEDVSDAPAGTVEHPLGMGDGDLARRKEHCRVEVALDGAVMTDARPSFGQRSAPIEPENRATSVTHRLEERRRASTEVDDRYTDRLDILQDRRDVGLHIFNVVCRR